MLGALLLVIAGAVLIVVRPLLAAAEFRSLQADWTDSVALNVAAARINFRFSQEAVPGDARAVTVAIVAVQRQEASRLLAIRNGISAGLADEAVLTNLATAERTALTDEIAELRGRVPLSSWSARTQLSIQQVQRLLTAGQGQLHVPPPGPAPLATLTAANTELARLRRVLDASVPADLLISGDGAVRLVNLRSGGIGPGPPGLQKLLTAEGGLLVVPRAGYLAVQGTDGSVDAISSDLGPLRVIGRGVPLAAARPGAVWIMGVPSGRPVLVNGSGRRLAGPGPRLRAPYLPVGLAVRGGLIVQGTGSRRSPTALIGGGLWLWNPLAGQALRRLAAGCAQPVAARGNTLAWLSCRLSSPRQVRLHITDVATGADRVIANPRGAIPLLAGVATGAFAPNGRWLAAYYEQTTGGADTIGLVNVRTGRTTVVAHSRVVSGTEAIASTEPILWAPGSERIFYGTGATGNFDDRLVDGTVPFATYRLGAAAAADLRVHLGSGALLAVLPP